MTVPRSSSSLSWMSVRWACRCLLLLLAAHHAQGDANGTKCSLPKGWQGKWFHSGVVFPVVIGPNKVDFKGLCVRRERDLFLFKDENHNCYRCLVIHEQHYNVLQYKETYCDTHNDLAYVCSLLAGDSLLNSLFRLNAQPIPCPFPDSYTFTYTRGHAECSYPKSVVDSCTVEHKMLFRYQACPDVQGTESYEEELMCLGTWREGSNSYLVGKSDNPMATSDEDRYQCFVFKDWADNKGDGYLVAQSGDATCNGLYSISGGSTRLILQRDSTGPKCSFPMWLEGGHLWHSLDNTTTLQVTRRNSTLRLSTPDRIVTHTCLMPYAHTNLSATYVTRVVHGCTSGYQCVQMITRGEHVLEIIMGKIMPVPTMACHKNHFNTSSTNFTTFVSNRAESRRCPGVGRYEVVGGMEPFSVSGQRRKQLSGRGGGGGGRRENKDMGGKDTAGKEAAGEKEGGGGGGALLYSPDEDIPLREQCLEGPFTHLAVGCSGSNTLILSNQCSSAEYSCHGSWEDGGREYLVVTPTSRSSKGVRRLCLVLERGAGVLSLASSSRSCGRDLTPGLHGHIALNTTSTGGCHSSPPLTGGGGGGGRHPATWILLSILLLLFHLLHHSHHPSM